MNDSLRALALVLTLVPLACDDGGDGEDGGSSNPRTDGVLALDGTAAAGTTVFTSVCGTSACHGADGNTPGTPDTKRLSDAAPGLDDRAVVDTVLNGVGAMPPQANLSDQQIADVLAYVRDTFG